MIDPPLTSLAEEIISLCIHSNLCIVTAESCTGGMIATALTATAGASAVMEGGFVTYSNEAKYSVLNIRPDMIAEFGAVSEEVAGAMAEGAIAASNKRATHAISVTGIAGPGGGSAAKPVGFVCFGCAMRDAPTKTSHMLFEDKGRDVIRQQSALYALTMLREVLS